MKQKMIYRVRLRVAYYDLMIDCDTAGYLDNVVHTFSKMWYERNGEILKPEISVDVIFVPENDGKDGKDGDKNIQKVAEKADAEIVGAVIRGIVIDG